MNQVAILLVLIILPIISLMAGCKGQSPNAAPVEEPDAKPALAKARDNFEVEFAKQQEEARELKNQFATHQAATRTVSIRELNVYPQYWNLDWTNNVLRSMVSSVHTSYFETHTYTLGEDDLYDMVIDIWNMLEAEGIISYIVCGNHYMQYESFQQCNYAWLLIYGRTTSYALDCETGTVRSQRWGRSSEYWEGYIYTHPDDLRADLGR